MPNLFATEVIAHRGASGHTPENTISAIKKAIELNSTYVEIDVHLTKDRKVVVFHDDSLARTTNGQGQIGSKTLSELKTLDAGTWFSREFSGEKIPSLAEVLKLNFKSSKLIIEIKNVNNIYDGIEKNILELVKTSSFKNEVIYKSFSSEVLEKIHLIDSRSKILYVTIGPVFGFLVIDDWLRFGSIFDIEYANYIQVHRYLINKKLIQKAHSLNKKIIVWDVHDQDTIQKMKN
jgi:glycerophosphoryl diester phosphodiesterase